jgi:threonine dehydrogenase-like Zn-dependent dehydrogenase
MQALFVTGHRERLLEWREAQAPRMEAPSDAIVSPIAVAACDLDRAIAAGRSPFPGEFMLGHEFTAEVVEIGADVKNVKPGDVVLASFQPVFAVAAGGVTPRSARPCRTAACTVSERRAAVGPVL